MPISAPRCQLLNLASTPSGPVQTAKPGDELVLVIEAHPASAPRALVVEVFRGDERRDRLEHTLPPSDTAAITVCRLRWRDRPDASSRLTCHVRLNGQLIGTPSVLLVGTNIDAQGRLANAPTRGMSDHTRIAVLGAFDRLLATSGEYPDPARVPLADGE